MSYNLCGIPLQSPFVVGSGPLCYGAEGILRLHQAGAGAIVTKTIALEAAYNPVRHMVRYNNNTLINCEKWADYDAERWLTRELPALKDSGAVVIASVGHTVRDSSAVVERAVEAGAAAIELVSYREETILPMLEDTRKRVSCPILVKLSPNTGDLVGFAKRCVEAGADAITACDSMGPALKIDIETGRPVLDGQGGSGWLSGGAIKPFTVQRIAALRQALSCPIIGLGGVASYEDAIEFAMAGADLIGVCTAPILQGVGVIGTMSGQISRWLEQHGHQSLADIKGAALAALPAEDLHSGYSMGFDRDKCIACRRCVQVCTYEARHLDEDKNMTVDPDKCRMCGLCVSVCPKGCL